MTTLPALTLVGLVAPVVVGYGVSWWWARNDSEYLSVASLFGLACGALTAAAAWPALAVAWWLR